MAHGGVGTKFENLASKDVYDEVKRTKVPAGVKPIRADETEDGASAEDASLTVGRPR